MEDYKENEYREKISRALKYIILAIITGASVKYVTMNDVMVSTENTIIIACIVSICYAALDRISPSVC